MHTNVHFAIGILFASLAHRLFPMNIWFFLLIIISATIADLDMVASKIAVNGDHRNFFTHSIYPAIILLLIGIPIGFFWNIHVVWISGNQLHESYFIGLYRLENSIILWKKAIWMGISDN